MLNYNYITNRYILCIFIRPVAVAVVVVVVEVVVVVVMTLQFEGSLSSGGLLAPDLHPWQGFLSAGQEEWRMQALGKDE